MKKILLYTYLYLLSINCLAQKKDNIDSNTTYLYIKGGKDDFILKSDLRNNSFEFYCKTDTLYYSKLGYEDKTYYEYANPASFFDLGRWTSNLSVCKILKPILGKEMMTDTSEKRLTIKYVLDRTGKVVETRFVLDRTSKITKTQLIEIYYQLKGKKISNVLKNDEQVFNNNSFYKTIKFVRIQMPYNLKKLIELEEE